MAGRKQKRYLLQNCGIGYLGNSPYFWHKSGSGYTQWIADAKEWTYAEAQQQVRSSRGSHRWRIWPKELVFKLAKLTVDIQDLDRETEKRKKKKNDLHIRSRASL